MATDYTAADVASCVVRAAIEDGHPVSNLQLQKILYFIQSEHLSSSGECLFDDEFEAWQYGPVIPSVYWSYSIFGGSPIMRAQEYSEVNILTGYKKPIVSVGGWAKNLIESITRKWDKVPAWSLVSRTHRRGGAWDRVYNRDGIAGSGKRDVIPKNLIKEDVMEDAVM